LWARGVKRADGPDKNVIFPYGMMSTQTAGSALGSRIYWTAKCRVPWNVFHALGVGTFDTLGSCMLWFYELFFPVVWILFLLYWQIKAGNTKSTQRLEPAVSRILRVFIFGIAIALLSTTRFPQPWLYLQLWPVGLWPFWLGAAVTVAGLLFAVWGREHLGRNWSRSVTIKQGHELITTGPYAVVRHPIYTGVLAGFLGMAIAISQVRGIIVFVLIFLALWLKLRMEDRWMRSQFGETYAIYARQTAALVPYLL
jgi:protein-S-isoprenylcysteine O-methyltransferase Ste14